MPCFVMLGDTPWCSCERSLELRREAALRNVSLDCTQETAADAVALCHLLGDFGYHATIAEGECPWNPTREMVKVLKPKPPGRIKAESW